MHCILLFSRFSLTDQAALFPCWVKYTLGSSVNCFQWWKQYRHPSNTREKNLSPFFAPILCFPWFFPTFAIVGTQDCTTTLL